MGGVSCTPKIAIQSQDVCLCVHDMMVIGKTQSKETSTVLRKYYGFPLISHPQFFLCPLVMSDSARPNLVFVSLRLAFEPPH